MKTKIESLKEVDTRELDIDDENLPEHFKMHYKLKSPLNMLWYNLVYEFKDNYPAKMNTDFARDMITLYSKKGDTVWDGCSGCYDKYTEVLTYDGWKSFTDVTFTDKIATLNPKSFQLEYQKPKQIIKKHYQGQMYKIESLFVDLVVTPDHKMFVAHRNSRQIRNKWKYELIDAYHISNKQVKYKKNAIWNGKSIDYFELKSAIRTNDNKLPLSNLPHINYHKVKIPIKLFLKFLGYYIAEGTCGRTDFSIILHTDWKDRHHKSMLQTTRQLAHILNRKVLIDKRGRIKLFDKRLWSYFQTNRGAHTKYISKDIKQLSSRLLNILVQALLDGDGHKDQLFTVSKQLADDFQEIVLKCGYSASIRKINSRISTIKNRKIVSGISYVVGINRTRNTPLMDWATNKRSIHQKHPFHPTEKWINYNDMIYCVEVPKYHVIYVRRNGKSVWCGNSGTVPIMAGKLDRRGIGTDVNPKAIELGIEHAVAENVTHLTSFAVADARTHIVKDVDLILCSLPFGLSIAGDKNNYSDEQGDISNSKDYNEFFSKTQEIIKNYYENLRPLGILILDSRDRTKKGEYHPLSFRFMQQAENAGFKILAIYHYIQVPYRLMPFTHGETEHTMPLVSTMDAIVMYKPANKTLDGVMQ